MRTDSQFVRTGKRLLLTNSSNIDDSDDDDDDDDVDDDYDDLYGYHHHYLLSLSSSSLLDSAWIRLLCSSFVVIIWQNGKWGWCLKQTNYRRVSVLAMLQAWMRAQTRVYEGKKSTFIGRDTNSGIFAVQVQFSGHLIRAR